MKTVLINTIELLRPFVLIIAPVVFIYGVVADLFVIDNPILWVLSFAALMGLWYAFTSFLIYVIGKFSTGLEELNHIEELYSNYSFSRATHELIWHYRLKGWTYKEISSAITSIEGTKLSVTTISRLDQLKDIYYHLPGTEKTFYYDVLKDYQPSNDL